MAETALPEGFRQLTYIESGGGQYIDLSAIALARVVMDVMPLGYGSLCGAYAYRSVSASRKAYITNDIRHTASGFLFEAWQAGSNAFAGAKLNARTTVDVNFYSGAAEVDGVSKTITIDTTARNMNNYSLAAFLLARRTGNSANSTVTATNAIPARLYGCKFYSRTGALVRDYVPAKNAAGVAGLYDLLHGGFLTSPSGTAFTAGAEIAPPKAAVTLTVSPSGGGEARGAGEYEPGESVTVRASPASGFRFLRWEEHGAQVSAAASYTFPVAAARSLTAVFERIPTYTVTLTASPAEGGAVSGAGTYAENAPATVRAAANDGFRFRAWSENGAEVSTAATYTFQVTTDRALSALFAPADAPDPPDPPDTPEPPSAPTGLRRRELYVDARDLQPGSDPDNPLTPEEYAALLTVRGAEKLAENQLVRSFEAAVRTLDPTYRLGEDFRLGDTITVTDGRLGVTANAVVRAAERTVSGAGEGLTLTLGYSAPTLHDILKRKAGR